MISALRKCTCTPVHVCTYQASTGDGVLHVNERHVRAHIHDVVVFRRSQVSQHRLSVVVAHAHEVSDSSNVALQRSKNIRCGLFTEHQL